MSGSWWCSTLREKFASSGVLYPCVPKSSTCTRAAIRMYWCKTSLSEPGSLAANFTRPFSRVCCKKRDPVKLLAQSFL